MNHKHKTKEGVILFVSEMDNNHLVNYIKLVLRGIEKLKVQLRKSEQPKDKFYSALYDTDDELTENELMDLIKCATENLYPYLSELSLRGIDMSERLQEVFEREGENKREIDETGKEEFDLLIENLG